MLHTGTYQFEQICVLKFIFAFVLVQSFRFCVHKAQPSVYLSWVLQGWHAKLVSASITDKSRVSNYY